MSKNDQRILVIQDASKKLCTTTVKWALHGLSLERGDRIIFLGIKEFRSVKASPLIGCLGQKTKLNSSATVREMLEDIQNENAKKLTDYKKSEEIQVMIPLCERQQIELVILVEAGNSMKEVTVQVAKNIEATCVILDSHMKKDHKYIMENLSCGVLRMKKDNSIKHLREPKTQEIRKTPADRGQCSHMNSETHNSGERQEEMFENRICTVCKNIRPMVGSYRVFKYCELEAATDGFSPLNILSKRSKETYRGLLSNGLNIVVRRFLRNQEEEDFLKVQVQMVSEAKHQKVAMLLGSCFENGHRCLVYEHVCNGSLDQHLSRKGKELSWGRRMKIALGASEGLQYLLKKNIYGCPRPRNILLTHEYCPRLMNFGVARNQYEELDRSSETGVMTTFEYLAPEYEETGDSSQTVVYSFGVVLLQLIAGWRTIEDTKEQSFLRWARPLLEQMKFDDLIDPIVLDSHDLQQLISVASVAKSCISWDPERRPSIDKVVTALTYINQGHNIKDLSPSDTNLI